MDFVQTYMFGMSCLNALTLCRRHSPAPVWLVAYVLEMPILGRVFEVW